jgi:drug/metabolite transporter (DMT)-like permease
MAAERSTAVAPVQARTLGAVALVLGAALCLGVVPILAKLAYRDHAGALPVLACRFLVAALLLGACSWRSREAPALRRRLPLLVAVGGAGYGGTAIFYFVALEHAAVGVVTVLFFTYPAVVLLVASLLRERIARHTVVAVACAAAGAALAVGPGGSASALGIALAGLASLTFAAYLTAASRLVQAAGALPVATSTTAGAGVLTLVAAAIAGGVHGADPAWLAWAAGSGALTAAGILALAMGVRRIGAPPASVISSVEPAVTVTAAALLLAEPFAAGQMVGALLVAAAAATSAWGAVGAPASPGP